MSISPEQMLKNKLDSDFNKLKEAVKYKGTSIDVLDVIHALGLSEKSRASAHLRMQRWAEEGKLLRIATGEKKTEYYLKGE